LPWKLTIPSDRKGTHIRLTINKYHMQQSSILSLCAWGYIKGLQCIMKVGRVSCTRVV
jgi:hypothetical protein